MGFPLRSNIFQIGTSEQRYFKRFPIQVAVLFSPTDQQFNDAFRELFLSLDKLTGESLAFFAVLDPPADWREAAASRSWWQRYREMIGEIGFSFDERTLVNELSRLFGVAWSELPVLIASTDLWTGELVIVPTTPWHIERQLTELTRLVDMWGAPGIEQIFEALDDMSNSDVRYQSANDDRRYRLHRVYGALDSYLPRQQGLDIERFRRYTDRELRDTMQGGLLDRVRQRHREEGREIEQDNKLVEETITEVAGRLVAPATVAMRALHVLRERDVLPDYENLSEESIVMIQTALNVGNYLESLATNAIQGLAPLNLRDPNRDIRRNPDWAMPVDYTPGAQGTWKALELELNLSVIQAARAARQIQMPQYFALYVDRFSKQHSRIQTRTNHRGQPEYRDLNARDPHHPHTGRHKFFTLGESWAITQAMLRDSDEVMHQVIHQSIGQPLPQYVFDCWHEVYQIRNGASHTHPLSRNEYERVIDRAIMSRMLIPLMQLKQALSR